mgnify:FL=1
MPDDPGLYSRYALDLAPPWLRAERGAKWLGAHGETLDALVERLVSAVAAHLVDTAPEDAVPVLGRERGIVRIPEETEEAYRGRVRAAWDILQWGGTRRAVEEVFRLLGYEQVWITELWTVDRSRWAEFGILIIAGPLVGGTTWDADVSWDSDGVQWDALLMESLTMEQVIALVNEVKAAHSRLVQITHIMGGFIWDHRTSWDSHPQDLNSRWDGDTAWTI